MNKRREGKGCFKVGCLGCAGVIILAIIIPLVLAGVGFLAGTPDRVQEAETYHRELPPLPAPAGGRPAEAPQGGDPGELASAFGAGERELMPQAVDLPPGRVEISLEMGDFIIEPGPPDGGIRVEADYDTASFELEEDYQAGEDGSWTYSIRFGSSVGMFRRMWNDSRIRNEVRIILPRGRPFVLDSKIAYGQSEVELGGLWLTSADLEARYGDHEVRFSEPLPAPLESFRYEGAFGESDVLGLGNASPATTKVSGRFGELDLDLAGSWRQDGTLDVDFSFGECHLDLPADTRIQVTRATMMAGEKHFSGLDGDQVLPEDAPTLTLALSASFGEMRVSR